MELNHVLINLSPMTLVMEAGAGMHPGACPVWSESASDVGHISPSITCYEASVTLYHRKTFFQTHVKTKSVCQKCVIRSNT